MTLGNKQCCNKRKSSHDVSEGNHYDSAVLVSKCKNMNSLMCDKVLSYFKHTNG